MKKAEMGLLGPYRVLDLTDKTGWFCARILGDLGADVIKVEPTRGDPGRCSGPFYQDEPDAEKSLLWFAYNSNKRGITLDIQTRRGQEVFRQLVKTSDFVVESWKPGYLNDLGLGYEDLAKINPRIILTSITPFGQDGPYNDYMATEIIIWAMGGMMYASGNSDRPPVRVSLPQGYLHASAAGAVGMLFAHYNRQITNKGQWVDVSGQEAVVRTLMNLRQFWDVNRIILKRAGPFRIGLSDSVNQRLIWKCKDGYVNFAIFGGAAGAKTNRALIQWLDEEGLAAEDLKVIDWESFDMAQATEKVYPLISKPLGTFFGMHTREELYKGALERKIMLYPVNTVEDLLKDPQLKARGFWQEVEHPELGMTFIYPGAFVSIPQAPIGIRRRAPLIGEHNEEIYEKVLGFSREKTIILKQEKVI